MPGNKIPSVSDQVIEGTHIPRGTLKYENEIQAFIKESLDNESLEQCEFDRPPSIHVITSPESYGTNDMNGYNKTCFKLGDHFSAAIQDIQGFKAVHGKIISIKQNGNNSYVFKMSDGREHMYLLVVKK